MSFHLFGFVSLSAKWLLGFQAFLFFPFKSSRILSSNEILARKEYNQELMQSHWGWSQVGDLWPWPLLRYTQPYPVLHQTAPETSVWNLYCSEEQTFKTTNWMSIKVSLGQKCQDALVICNIITVFQNWISCLFFSESWPQYLSVSSTHTLVRTQSRNQLNWALLILQVK